MQTFPLLLTWTPAPVMVRNLKAKIYRNPEMGKWVVLVRDSVHDDARRRKYVSTRDFDMLADAERWAHEQTGKPAKVSI
jgi:hypothetical protein